MHLPFTPHHVQLISACYPPSAALITSGPDYRPNAQELSRLTYYAANTPGKIHKLGSELEKRIRGECRKAQGGNSRSRASLLISLSVLRTLATECRRDISLLTPSLLVAVDLTLDGLSSDLEVSAKVASLFTAWTTHTDGRLIGVDNDITKDYMSILNRFSHMSTSSSTNSDKEFQNRTRLVGLAALTGAVTSEALYSSTYFQSQVSTIVPALLANIHDLEVSVLESELIALKEKPNSPYMAQSRSRPPAERRAASIHIHIDGDKGPSTADVSQTCLRALSSLFGHSTGSQATHIMEAVLQSLDRWKSWERIDHCRWITRQATDWTQYQYRYAIPTRLVERLQQDQDVPMTTPLHNALAVMLTTIFTSPTPLINLSTSDIISILITLVLRRCAIDPEDPVLPALVECIASVGTHVYYSDQIYDLASELVSRIVSVEATGGRGESNDRGRSQALRALLSGLVGLIRAPKEKEHTDDKHSTKSSTVSPSTSQGTDNTAHGDSTSRPSRRTKVTPELWQETFNLLCDESFSVREEYANALIFYLQTEISCKGEYTDTDGVRRIRPLAEGPVRQGANMLAMVYGDSSTRFLNALHFFLYILATSSTLGVRSSTPSPARSTNGDDQPTVNITPPTPMESQSPVGLSETQESPPQSQHARRSLSIQIRTRKQSAAQRMLRHVPSQLSAATSSAATGSDYRNILAMLTAMHENLPVRGLLTGVPFLVALDAVTRASEAEHPVTVGRMRAIREVLARVWLVIAKVWDCAELLDMAEKALENISSSISLPPAAPKQSGVLTAPEQPVPIIPFNDSEFKWQGVDAQAAVSALALNKTVLEATRSPDSQALLLKLSVQWTAENALRDSVEPQSTYDALRGDGVSPRSKIAPALMHIENMSLQSLSRPSRGVGVTDLREALEGRSSMSNPALVNVAPSVSTLEHASVAHGENGVNRLVPVRSRPEKALRNPGEVRDVLNKLRIGKANGSTSLLKSSFPALQRPDARPSLLPPYKS